MEPYRGFQIWIPSVFSHVWEKPATVHPTQPIHPSTHPVSTCVDIQGNHICQNRDEYHPILKRRMPIMDIQVVPLRRGWLVNRGCPLGGIANGFGKPKKKKKAGYFLGRGTWSQGGGRLTSHESEDEDMTENTYGLKQQTSVSVFASMSGGFIFTVVFDLVRGISGFHMLLVDIPEGNSVSQKQKGEFVWIVKRWMRIHPPILVGLNGKIPKWATKKQPALLSIESWSFHRDPYFMVYIW